MQHWLTVKNKYDLIRLNESNCWDDSEMLEFYSSPSIPYIPEDTPYGSQSIKVLLKASSAFGAILELVFINVKYASYEYLCSPHFFHSRIDELKRLYVEPPDQSVAMQCERVTYKYCENLDIHYSGKYYATAQANVDMN